MESADIGIGLPNLPEACAANVAPTTSTTLQLALGDALAMAVMDMRGVSKAHLRDLHPGGSIGLHLTPIVELMHRAREMPLVPSDASMPDVISKMTSGRFGVAGVIDEAGSLIGVISDGDLRRRFDILLTARAADIMTRSPLSLPKDMLAADALAFLNENKITSVFVLDRHDSGPPDRPVGIVHIHDLLRFGLSGADLSVEQ
jgi:arabinose-5-phosphate isomerase